MPGYSQIHHWLVYVFGRIAHFIGNAKTKKGSQDLPLNLNIVLCPLPLPKSFGFVAYLQILVFLRPQLPHFMGTILVPSVSLRIQFFMNVQNILRWIVILFETNIIARLFVFHMFWVNSNLQTSSPKDRLGHAMSSWFANDYYLTSINLRWGVSIADPQGPCTIGPQAHSHASRGISWPIWLYSLSLYKRL